MARLGQPIASNAVCQMRIQSSGSGSIPLGKDRVTWTQRRPRGSSSGTGMAFSCARVCGRPDHGMVPPRKTPGGSPALPFAG